MGKRSFCCGFLAILLGALRGKCYICTDYRVARHVLARRGTLCLEDSSRTLRVASLQSFLKFGRTMKRLFVFLMLFPLFFVACQTIELPHEEEGVKGKKQRVSVQVRSITSEPLLYPLSVYAFDTSGQLRGTQTINDAQAKLNLSLPAGNYRIVALSGHDAYRFSKDNVTLNSVLAPQEHGVAQRPLMRGEAALEVEQHKARVSLTMHYVVASVDLNLKNIPPKVTAVHVRLDRQYGQLLLNGEYAEPTTSTIACRREPDGTWRLPTSYVFPASTRSTVLSIALSEAEQTRNFSFTLSQPLKAATPYRLSGTYTPTDEIDIATDILSAGWNMTVSQDFSFGANPPIDVQPGNGHGDTGGNTPGGDTGNGGSTVPPVAVPTDLPTPGTVWNGKHVVGLLDNVTDTGADLLLISLQKWDGLPSARNVDGATHATTLAAQYTEHGLTGWTIPTKEEARALAKSYHGDALKALNASFKQLGAQEIYDVIETKYEKYLCDEANHIYSFKEGTTISAAGKSSFNYYLLLVKRIHVERKKP